MAPDVDNCRTSSYRGSRVDGDVLDRKVATCIADKVHFIREIAAMRLTCRRRRLAASDCVFKLKHPGIAARILYAQQADRVTLCAYKLSGCLPHSALLVVVAHASAAFNTAAGIGSKSWIFHTMQAQAPT